jgi:hypothetical protein
MTSGDFGFDPRPQRPMPAKPPSAAGVLRYFDSSPGVTELVSLSVRRRPRSSRICPFGCSERWVRTRDELAAVFADAQRAIAAGDLDALTAQLAASADSQAGSHYDAVRSALSSSQSATSGS